MLVSQGHGHGWRTLRKSKSVTQESRAQIPSGMRFRQEITLWLRLGKEFFSHKM